MQDVTFFALLMPIPASPHHPVSYTHLDVYKRQVKGLPYDPENAYSVPYFWGTVGIVYDTTKVSEEDLENEGFNIFLDEKYKGDIYLYDSERDSFMMALKALGYSMNTDDEGELQAAYDWLVRCVQTMEPEIVTDEIIDNMAQSRKALGLIYSGDAAYVMSENEDMGFYLPESGTNLWSDAMVIPANAKNPDLAHEFINHVCAYEAVSYTHLASVIKFISSRVTFQSSSRTMSRSTIPFRLTGGSNFTAL